MVRFRFIAAGAFVLALACLGRGFADLSALKGSEQETILNEHNRLLVEDRVFVMGALDLSDMERPMQRARVTGGSFIIDRYEVTNKEYKEFLNANQAYPPPYNWEVERSIIQFPRMADGNFEGNWLPVTFVSLNDAEAFAAWRSEGDYLNALLGIDPVDPDTKELGWRWVCQIPTELEWEFAARGTDGRFWPWGGGRPLDNKDEEGWEKRTWSPALGQCNSIEKWVNDVIDYEYSPDMSTALFRREIEHEFEGFKEDVRFYDEWKSPCGAVNMAGNVWEWTTSPLRPYAGSTVIHDDFKGYEINVKGEIETHEYYVVRGGSFMCGKFWCRSARRHWEEREATYPDLGFRCVYRLVKEAPAGPAGATAEAGTGPEAETGEAPGTALEGPGGA